MLALWSAGVSARETVDASPPTDLAVTLYRDPQRGVGGAMNRNWPRGFAMITETRTVTLPPGESTIRFEGVAEGMVAVSAIVTGLPGGTIEKNRNANLLSPGALVDGTLGNRVTITRTNPATGVATSEEAIVQTGAYSGLVLKTSQGFESLRCAGLPEKLTFDRVPAGLSPQPVFSIDTRDARGGGTYTVQLTYLAWGFDWQAHYVATLAEAEANQGDKVNLRLMSWLTLLNDNGQGFPDAELLVVAGTLKVTSNFRALAAAPDAKQLVLVCYPRGSTAEGSPEDDEPDFYGVAPPPPPPPPAPITVGDEVVVTAQARMIGASAPAMVAAEEALGDLKLYRVPERVTVSAKGLKQVAFLDRGKVEGRLLYKARCSPWDERDEAQAAMMLLATVNDKRHGLGVALPMGGVTVFEPSSFGDQLVGEEKLRDYAEGQDIEIGMGASSQVFATCSVSGDEVSEDAAKKWRAVSATLTNANPAPVTVRLSAGPPGSWRLRGLKRSRLKDGETIVEVVVPANGERKVTWQVKPAGEV
jgi:hypothetical protein